MREFILIGEGRQRRVYRHGNYVVKIPINRNGVHDNWHEYEVFKHRETYGYIQYARCRLLGDILIMQYARCVGPLSDSSGYIPMSVCPEWAYSVDCCQVGYNRFGQIVAYDYGIY